LKTFRLQRQKDISGVSGTGIVAQGVVFDNGWVALCWLTETSSVVIYKDIAHVEKIHGHSGNTTIIFD